MNRKFLGLFVITFLWVFYLQGATVCKLRPTPLLCWRPRSIKHISPVMKIIPSGPNQHHTSETAAMLYRLLTEDSKNQFTTDHNLLPMLIRGNGFALRCLPFTRQKF